MSWLTDLFDKKFPTMSPAERLMPLASEGALEDAAEIRLAAAQVRMERERQRLIYAVGQAKKRANHAQRVNRRLVRGAKALRAKWPKIYKEFFPFEVEE